MRLFFFSISLDSVYTVPFCTPRSVFFLRWRGSLSLERSSVPAGRQESGSAGCRFSRRCLRLLAPALCSSVQQSATTPRATESDIVFRCSSFSAFSPSAGRNTPRRLSTGWSSGRHHESLVHPAARFLSLSPPTPPCSASSPSPTTALLLVVSRAFSRTELD